MWPAWGWGRHFDGTQATVPSPSSTPKSHPAAAVPSHPAGPVTLCSRESEKAPGPEMAARERGLPGFVGGRGAAPAGQVGGLGERRRRESYPRALRETAAVSGRRNRSLAVKLCVQSCELPAGQTANPDQGLSHLQRSWPCSAAAPPPPSSAEGQAPPPTFLGTHSLTHSLILSIGSMRHESPEPTVSTLSRRNFWTSGSRPAVMLQN